MRKGNEIGGDKNKKNKHFAASSATMNTKKMFGQLSAAEPPSIAPATSRNDRHDLLGTDDPATNLAMQVYRAKINSTNENEDVDALFAAHLVQETNRLAQDMNGMSAEEREQAYFDLHGIPSTSCSPTTMNSTASSSLLPDTDGVSGSSTGSSDKASCPQQVAAKWIEFQQEIHKLSDADRQGYELACELEAARTQTHEQLQRSEREKSWASSRSSSYSISSQESYVFNEKLLFAFFQSSRWNCKAAAEQFVAFWAIKLQLFGKDLLLHDIKLSDLDAEELAWLETGHLQLLPGTDRAGRAVFCIYRRLMRPMVVEKQMRVFFYFLMTRVVQSLPDETQRKGMVILLYSINLATLFTTPEGPVKLPMLVSRLPIRVIATHSCTNHARQLHLSYLSSRFLGNFTRVRSRVHFGSDIECQHTLATFGITRPLLTVTSQGDILVEDHLQWMNEQWEREKEDTRSVTPIITTTTATTALTQILDGCTPPPSVVTAEEDGEDSCIHRSSHVANDPNTPSLDRAGGGIVDDRDVLFGKGRGIQERPGNLRYRQLIESNLELYNKASKLKKRNVCQGIVRAILNSGGLFLRQEQPGGVDETNGSKFTSVGSNTQWVMVDHEAALEKVSHGFRNKRNSMGQAVQSIKAKTKAKLKP